MTIVKIYKYRIKEGTEELYLRLQEKAQTLYREFAKVEFIYLKDPNDPLLRTEIVRFFDPNSEEIIKRMDSDERILRLFEEFKKEVLDSSSEIEESHFIEVSL